MYNIRSGAIRWQIPDILPSGNSNFWIFQPLLNSHLKSLTLQVYVKGMEYKCRTVNISKTIRAGEHAQESLS